MKRRCNGEGTIFKRKDGRWEAQLYVTQADGIYKRVGVSGKTQEIVRKKLKKLQEQESLGIPYSDKDWSIVEYLDRWLKETEGSIRESTRNLYTHIIKTHLKPVLLGYKLKSFSAANGRYVIKQLENKGLGGATMQKCYQILHACLNHAVRDDELVPRNIMWSVDKPAYEPKETMIWTVEQAAHFLRTIKGHPQYIAFLLSLSRGMRRGEVLGIRYSDIDFDRGEIHIRQQIGRINGELKASVLKTKNSRRVLPLTDNIRGAILAHAKRNGITISPFNPQFELSTQGTIVTSDAGTPMEPRNYLRMFKQLAQKAGLPPIKLHALRHISATLLKDENMPDKDAQLFFGHANISTTKNIYQHGTKSVQYAAVFAAESRLLNG